MELNKHGAHWFKGSKEGQYIDYEDDHRYEELRCQSTKTRNVKEISIYHPTTPRRSLKPLLAVLLFIILICGLASTSALYGLEKRKSEGSRGHSFLISFIQSNNNESESNRTIIVSSETDFNLTVSLPETKSSSLVSISSRRSGNIIMKKLDVHYSLVPFYFTPEYKGIIINTSVPSTVLSYHGLHLSPDTTTVLPITKLSTSYILLTAPPTHNYFDSGSHFTVASLNDNTLVSIVFALDHDTDIALQGRSYGRGDKFNIILNRYQTFQIGHQADMTGTTIHSSKPVAVFAGNSCSNVSYYGYCSMLMEMVPPTEELDNVFIVPPNIHRFQSHVRIASIEKTDIKYSTEETSTRTLLLKNRFAEFLVREHEIGVIFSTKPVLVNSIAASSANAKIYGDAFMVTIPGINQYLNAYTNFVPEGYNFSFVTFMIKHDSLRNLQINGTKFNVESCLFKASVSVGKHLYYVCTTSVSSGVIDVKTSDGSRFGFIVTGQRAFDGHGYTGNTLLNINCET